MVSSDNTRKRRSGQKTSLAKKAMNHQYRINRLFGGGIWARLVSNQMMTTANVIKVLTRRMFVTFWTKKP